MLSLLLASALAATPAIPFQELRLDNGLDLILSEDHDVPIVQVDVWYHVGSKDEPPGRTGFAHLFEHLMFQGSAHSPGEYFEPLQRVGGRVNGSTSTDRTNYFEGVPAEYLPLALWMEADRMGWLLDTVDQARLDNQRDVVLNERRQSYELRPYGTAWLTLQDALFPQGHPYHHPTIGSHHDVESASLADVRDFFHRWYAPDDATLVIAGDFDPGVAIELVRRYFGDIPRGEEPRRADPPPVELDGERVIRQAEAGVPDRRVWIAWPTPAIFQPGDAELDVLSSVLSDGKDSRLVRELVMERRIARSVSAAQVSRQLAGIYVIQATAAPGHDTDELVQAIDGVLDRLRSDPPSQEEVRVAVTGYEAGFWRGLGTVAARADKLAAYQHFTGDAGYIDRDLARYRSVRPEAVREALRRWLPAGRRVVLHISPAGEGG